MNFTSQEKEKRWEVYFSLGMKGIRENIQS